MVVETVEKKAGAGGKVRRFRGDASKVVAKGQGLKKAFTNRLMNFQVDIKDAGELVGSVIPIDTWNVSEVVGSITSWCTSRTWVGCLVQLFPGRHQ